MRKKKTDMSQSMLDMPILQTLRQRLLNGQDIKLTSVGKSSLMRNG